MTHKTLSEFMASFWPPGWLEHGCACAGKAAKGLDTRTAWSADAARPHSPETSANQTYKSPKDGAGHETHKRCHRPVNGADAAKHRHANNNNNDDDYYNNNSNRTNNNGNSNSNRDRNRD